LKSRGIENEDGNRETVIQMLRNDVETRRYHNEHSKLKLERNKRK